MCQLTSVFCVQYDKALQEGEAQGTTSVACGTALAAARSIHNGFPSLLSGREPIRERPQHWCMPGLAARLRVRHAQETA
jgi:hypothetical protein